MTVIDRTDVSQLHARIRELEHQLQANHDRMERQLTVAERVHRSLLPGPIHDERIHVDVRYQPIEQVGGDYCQVRFSDRNTCYITICDVTGHGIGAALLATRVSSEVWHSILYGRRPSEVVGSLNRFVCNNFGQTGLYLTFLCAQIDLQRHEITWCGAGHPAPILVRRATGESRQLDSQNLLIGVEADALDSAIEQTTPLTPGDRLLLYTDGVTESEDGDGQMLGVNGLTRIAVETRGVDLFDVADQVLDRITTEQDHPPTDDMTLIVVDMR